MYINIIIVHQKIFRKIKDTMVKISNRKITDFLSDNGVVYNNLSDKTKDYITSVATNPIVGSIAGVIDGGGPLKDSTLMNNILYKNFKNEFMKYNNKNTIQGGRVSMPMKYFKKGGAIVGFPTSYYGESSCTTSSFINSANGSSTSDASPTITRGGLVSSIGMNGGNKNTPYNSKLSLISMSTLNNMKNRYESEHHDMNKLSLSKIDKINILKKINNDYDNMFIRSIYKRGGYNTISKTSLSKALKMM